MFSFLFFFFWSSRTKISVLAGMPTITKTVDIAPPKLYAFATGLCQWSRVHKRLAHPHRTKKTIAATYLVGKLIGGPLVDKYLGGRLALYIMLIVVAGSAIAMAFSTQAWHFYLFYGLNRLGSSLGTLLLCCKQYCHFVFHRLFARLAQLWHFNQKLVQAVATRLGVGRHRHVVARGLHTGFI